MPSCSVEQSEDTVEYGFEIRVPGQNRFELVAGVGDGDLGLLLGEVRLLDHDSWLLRFLYDHGR